VQLGVRFRPAVDGDIVGLRFFKSAENVGPHYGSLWNADGTLIAQAPFDDTNTTSGWQRASIRPVAVAAGQEYVASYLAPNGHYAADPRTLGSGRVVTHGPLTAIAGVYNYADAMPTQSWRETKERKKKK
jgi:hypothetical protein